MFRHVGQTLLDDPVDGERDSLRKRFGYVDPLRFVPRGHKRIVLGLVTSKRGELEDARELRERIEQAARYVPLDQLALSPQCGFASTCEGNSLSFEQQNAIERFAHGSLLKHTACQDVGHHFNGGIPA